MTQQDNTTGPSKILTPVMFAPVPLVSGNSVVIGESEEQVTGVRVVISTAGSPEALEVDLEFRFGGWWATQD